eukprot:CAMPEP_0114349018 /NCGR_PEP_ID=MMETSP0101-20121206/15205_1 /TAXON_ID=38822 ORGANISM="Pteridomonas danica, Strain PT" /NCGR_SAMPLE_ID=MMETSP0101 /ASSEMBLY_ACC=CAM_ASM_000211 /LENGTH=353 /DNA_ID=CAMNT_0001487357 /DNA_START=86 /DNA_END=1145 /DNA_ORIENTATION=-
MAKGTLSPSSSTSSTLVSSNSDDQSIGREYRSTVDATHSTIPVSSYDPPQQQVVKKVATCKRCGEVLPRDMDAIEKHEETCVGYTDTSNDTSNLSSEAQIIQNAFVCPQCFKEFESQQHVLDHFPDCDGGAQAAAVAASSLLPQHTSTDSGSGGKQRRTSLANLMFGSNDKNVSKDGSIGSGGSASLDTVSLDSIGSSEDGSNSASLDTVSLDSIGSSEDGSNLSSDIGAVAALNDMLAGGSAGTGSCAPGMELSGWVEKHNRVNGWQRRWFMFNSEMGRLQYYKYSGPSEFNGEPQSEMLELKGVIDIRYVDIGHKEGEWKRINIEAGPRQYKLKVQSDAEGRHWCEQLQVW